MTPEKHTVEFEAMKIVKELRDVTSTMKAGRKVEFEAEKPTK